MLEQLDANAMDSAAYGLNLGNSANTITPTGVNSTAKPQRLITIAEDGTLETIVNSSGAASITLSDLLSDNTQYIIGYESDRNAYALDGAIAIQDDIVGDANNKGVLDWLYDSFNTILGGTAASATALQVAYNAVYDLVYPNDNLRDEVANGYGDGGGSDANELFETVGNFIGSTKNKENFQNGVATESENYLGMTYYGNRAKKWFASRKNDKSSVALNLNNIAKVFLTAYVDYMQGDESNYSWQKGKISDCNLYDSNEDDFTFTITTETSTSEEDSPVLASYYDTMFNMICLNGWTENAQIDDSEYLGEMLKSGMAFISSISDDGYYYQGNYSTDKYILEVTDDEAISKAEAKYNTEKTKIENKEDTIDLKMKNLDTEISSLTTEYDTTKSIISKSIEKSFKRYDA